MNSRVNLTPVEQELAQEIGFNPTVLMLIKAETGNPLERLYGTTEDDEDEVMDGLSVVVKREEIESILASLQPKLLPLGYRAFWSKRRLPNGMVLGDELAVLSEADPYTILHIKQTNGANYSIFLEDILERLRSWTARCQFDVLGAASDWVALRFQTLPADLCAFAQEIYEFCPDTVEQGVGLLSEGEDPELFEQARRLCPELSEQPHRTMQDSSDAELRLTDTEKQQGEVDLTLFERLGLKQEDPLFELMKRYLPQSTPTEMGIRLLAAELQRSKYLFLWWD